MRTILTPEVVQRLGVVLFRPGPEAMSVFCQGRVLIETLPDHLEKYPTGVVPAVAQPLADDPVLLPFFTNEKVISAVGGLAALDAELLRGRGCQYPHSS
jgi:hypothetical protein